MVLISQLWCYPVKSCQGIAVDTLQLDRFGAVGDRRWMIVNEQGGFITQRQQPRLGQISVKWDGVYLQLGATGMPSLTLPGELAKLTGVPMPVTVWGDCCNALDQGDEAASWLSDWLGETCRLVAMPDTSIRHVDPQYAQHQQTVAFADGFHLLLTSESSLLQFSHWLGRAVEMERFRPNIVLKGAEPWAEDNWDTLVIEGASYQVVKPCSRCVIPSLNLLTGSREADVLQTLVKYRKGVDEKIYFGQNVLYSQYGAGFTPLMVGQSVLA